MQTVEKGEVQGYSRTKVQGGIIKYLITNQVQQLSPSMC